MISCDLSFTLYWNVFKFKKGSVYPLDATLWGEVGCTIYSFICLYARAIELQPCCFAIILLLYASLKVISVLVLFVIFVCFFMSVLYRWAFSGFSCCFCNLPHNLHFSLLSLLQHSLSQWFGGSWLWAWTYSPMVFQIPLGFFGLPLLWIGTPCT